VTRRSKEGFNQPFAGLGQELERLVPTTSTSTKPNLAKATLKAPSAPAPLPAAAPKPLSDEELFLAEIGGTARIDRSEGRVGAPPPDPDKRPRRPSDDAEVLATLADLCDGDGAFDIADSDEYIEGVADGIDRRLLKRLRAGEYAVQAHLDLHGATREEAKERVARFILDSRRAGRRCVLLVHGRGNHSKDQIPVLKMAVRSWLERGHIARSVLAFATARPADGGAGAVYVLLRR
jgi:DNA-nicking Smr family endonuclease